MSFMLEGFCRYWREKTLEVVLDMRPVSDDCRWKDNVGKLSQRKKATQVLYLKLSCGIAGVVGVHINPQGAASAVSVVDSSELPLPPTSSTSHWCFVE